MRGDLTIRQYAYNEYPGGTYLYRVQPTPRFNIRYAPWAWWTLRASVGMGYRTPDVLTDNAQYMPTGRWFTNSFNQTSYMADVRCPNIESALNTGVTTTFYIPIADRELQLTGEYYYTRFFDCLVSDTETAERLLLYNLSDIVGAQAFTHTWQVEATMEVLRGWTWTLAYRQNDSRQTVFSPSAEKFVTRERPLQNKFKALITTSYQTPLKKWQFDLTAQFNGPGRMPEGYAVPAGAEKQYFTRELAQTTTDGQQITTVMTYHRWHPQLLAQITKYWRTCSLYVGAENMTNFMQHQPIIGTNAPFSSAFDAASVWAPTSGWKIYVGFRWNLQREEE